MQTKATPIQLSEMLEQLNPIIKLAVDVRRKILAGGGLMLADCEATLIENGSQQDDIWGANWIPTTQTVELEALININPRRKNFSMTIQDLAIKEQVENIVRQLLEGVCVNWKIFAHAI